MDINKLKSQLAAMQEEINRTAEQYGLGGHLQRMLNGGEIHQLPVMPYGFAKQGSYMTNTKVYSPEELKTMKLNQATSIVDAMKLMGDDSSFANRKMMAERMGIKNYTGTPAQNEELMQKYYASKRPFSDDQDMMGSPETNTPGLASKTPTLSPSGNRPAPQLPSLPQNVVQDQGMVSGMYEVDEGPSIMMNDRATGTAMPPDTRVRTLADLPPRETMAPVDLSQRLEKTPIAEMPETRRPAPAKPSSGGSKKAPAKKPAAPAASNPVVDRFGDKTRYNKGFAYYDDGPDGIDANNPYNTPFPNLGNYGEMYNRPTPEFGPLQSTHMANSRWANPDVLGPVGERLLIDKDGEILGYSAGSNIDEVSNYQIEGTPNELLSRLGQRHPDDYNEEGERGYRMIQEARMRALTQPRIGPAFMNKVKKENGGMNYFAGGEIENDPHIMELYGFQNGGEVIQLPVMPYGFAEMGMMTGDDVTGKTGKTNPPTGAPKMMNSQQLAGLATQFFSRDPSMQTPIPNFVGSYQLSNMDKTLMMEAMKQMKAGQGSTGVYPVITPQMIDQLRPRVEQNEYFNESRTQRMGGMNYEDGGQMPMDIAVARFKAAAKDKGLSGGEAMAYVEKMKSKYKYQKGGAVSEKELGNYEVGMYGTGGIMYNGTKFPGYNKPISTAPGDKFKKQMVLQKGGKIKLVKFGHR